MIFAKVEKSEPKYSKRQFKVENGVAGTDARNMGFMNFIKSVYLSISHKFASRQAEKLWKARMAESKASAEMLVKELEAIVDERFRSAFISSHMQHCMRGLCHESRKNAQVTSILRDQMQKHIRLAGRSETISQKSVHMLKSNQWILCFAASFLDPREANVFRSLGVKTFERNLNHENHYFIHTPSKRFPTFEESLKHVRYIKQLQTSADGPQEKRIVVICSHTKLQPICSHSYNAGTLQIPKNLLVNYDSMRRKRKDILRLAS